MTTARQLKLNLAAAALIAALASSVVVFLVPSRPPAGTCSRANAQVFAAGYAATLLGAEPATLVMKLRPYHHAPGEPVQMLASAHQRGSEHRVFGTISCTPSSGWENATAWQ